MKMETGFMFVGSKRISVAEGPVWYESKVYVWLLNTTSPDLQMPF